MKGVLSNLERADQMQHALATGFPFLERAGGFTDERIAVACYGPSLNDTWRALRDAHLPILSVSGAHDFLVERHVIPTWHVDCDPRPHKVSLLAQPRPEVEYLMASVCHPDWWDVLEHSSVKLWHLVNDQQTVEWVAQHHPAGMECLIGGGSTAGQRALNVAAALGYRRFQIYGMDCSYTDQRHAGTHPNQQQPIVAITIANRKFKTTPQLMQAAQEMIQFILTKDVEVEFHGDGMLQEMVRFLNKKRKTL